MNNKKGQQEIVGFVLIVGLVLIGLMVFLLISIRAPEAIPQSKLPEDLLSSMLRTTTSCAISFEPDYDDLEELFKNCQRERSCSNLGVSTCEHLNQTLDDILDNLLETEATVNALELKFYENEEGDSTLLDIFKGNCSSSNNQAFGSKKNLLSGSQSLVIELNLCEAA